MTSNIAEAFNDQLEIVAKHLLPKETVSTSATPVIPSRQPQRGTDCQNTSMMT